MTYFDRLALRAHGERLTNAVMPRPTSWYDGGGFASEDTVALPVVSPREPAVIASPPGAPVPFAPVADVVHARSPAAEPARSPAPATPATAISASAAGPIPVARQTITRVVHDPEHREAPEARAGDDRLGAASAPMFGEREPTHEAAGAAPSLHAMPIPASAKADAIRVHIGRVDVRAVFPPAPVPRSAPERAGPAMSLEHFLSRGRGGKGSDR